MMQNVLAKISVYGDVRFKHNRSYVACIISLPSTSGTIQKYSSNYINIRNVMHFNVSMLLFRYNTDTFRHLHCS